MVVVVDLARPLGSRSSGLPTASDQVDFPDGRYVKLKDEPFQKACFIGLSIPVSSVHGSIWCSSELNMCAHIICVHTQESVRTTSQDRIHIHYSIGTPEIPDSNAKSKLKGFEYATWERHHLSLYLITD